MHQHKRHLLRLLHHVKPTKKWQSSVKSTRTRTETTHATRDDKVAIGTQVITQRKQHTGKKKLTGTKKTLHLQT